MPKIQLNEEQKKKQKILVIGAVAGGATFAARARRLSEEAEIIMYDRGPYVSFANCGLPYYIGQVIPEEKNLLLVTKEDFKVKFNIDVRLFTEVTKIDPAKKELSLLNVQTGETSTESYDKVVISTGSSPVKPPLPGIDLPGIYTLRNIPDANEIIGKIKANKVKDAVIVGGGLIGMEMTENLANLGIKVSVVEMLPNVIPFFDPEMAVPIHAQLKAKGVDLHLNTAVKGFKKLDNGRLEVQTDPETSLSCDMVILSIGSRPESILAKDAGLELGARGGIKVNEQMQTSVPDVYAVGDAVESKDIVTGEYMLSLLASPANRQGRIAADNIFGKPRSFRGVQQTAVCRIFDIDIASTGASEKSLKRSADNGNVIPYQKIYLHPKDHADYYPGAVMMDMKVLYSPEDGRILGAQAVGGSGVEKRIDVIAMAIQLGGTVYDLEEAEMCYAPQFGSAKDAENMAGMTAGNILRGDVPTVSWGDFDPNEVFILDPRSPEEFAAAHVEGAQNFPLGKLRKSLDQLPKDKTIHVYCNVGKTSYYVSRILLLNGFDVYNISGGIMSYRSWKATTKK